MSGIFRQQEMCSDPSVPIVSVRDLCVSAVNELEKEWIFKKLWE
jgi:hypothetical protein